MTAFDVIAPHFLDLSESQLLQLNALAETVWTWNAKINVISRKDPHVMERQHHNGCHDVDALVPIPNRTRDGVRLVELF